MNAFRAGVDIGGTFTDIVLRGDRGERYTKKVSSTVDDYARAITEGLSQLLAEIDGEARGIAELLHGTTVASNAILEHKGAKTGLITTKGFRDVLEIRNLRMPRLYDMSWTKPLPLVERRLRAEADERINAEGEVDRPLDEASVEQAVHFLVGVQALTRRIGIDKAISFDMGGTTAKASLIENGELTRATEYQVGAGIVLGSRLLSGAGYTLKVPAIDLAEVGAGGGSILWIDAGGALQIGPHSAGAVPGPVCYDQGGTEPTVTDANVVLGYINPAQLVGGALKLHAKKARGVIAENIARPLGMSVEEAAYGAHLIAASNMIRALKAVSSERGRDPRDYALVAFGGNGPVFAAGMAEAMHIPQVLIPPSAGVFSSFGLLYAEVEYYFTRTRKRLLRALDPAEAQDIIEGLEAEARARLAADGFAPERIELRRSASLHYQGQSFELRVPLAAGRLDATALATLEEAFGVEHERTYGHRAGAEEPVELVSLEVIGRGIPDTPRAAAAAAASLAPDITIANPKRRAYFGPQDSWCDAKVVNRSALKTPHAGPCIVEEYDATCLVPPGWTARLDQYGNLVLMR